MSVGWLVKEEDAPAVFQDLDADFDECGAFFVDDTDNAHLVEFDWDVDARAAEFVETLQVVARKLNVRELDFVPCYFSLADNCAVDAVGDFDPQSGTLRKERP